MTPLYKISLAKSNGAGLWAKLESRNPTGSHKDRSLPVWISQYLAKGINNFCISSSGNSALSAANFCAENKASLRVFIRPDASAEKISTLKKSKNVTVIFTATPKRDAIRFARSEGVVNLRGSTDDKALVGYESIARELSQQLPGVANIFVPTSSGATLEGIYMGYKKNRRTDPGRRAKLPSGRSAKQSAEQTRKTPSFYAVQTTKVHPIADYFDKEFRPERQSHATAIVDNIAHRKDSVVKIIQGTGGGGYVISNKELEEARALLMSADFKPIATDTQSVKISQQSAVISVEPGWQSALSFAGFLRWQHQNSNKTKLVSVCLFTD